jgi:hypothetical protein
MTTSGLPLQNRHRRGSFLIGDGRPPTGAGAAAIAVRVVYFERIARAAAAAAISRPMN